MESRSTNHLFVCSEGTALSENRYQNGYSKSTKIKAIPFGMIIALTADGAIIFDGKLLHMCCCIYGDCLERSDLWHDIGCEMNRLCKEYDAYLTRVENNK